MVAVGSYEKSNKKSEVYENGNWRSVPDYPTAGARKINYRGSTVVGLFEIGYFAQNDNFCYKGANF